MQPRGKYKAETLAWILAGGFARWPRGVAHLGVLTAAPARGRGLATATACSAVEQALSQDLLPQWRARPIPSPAWHGARASRSWAGQAFSDSDLDLVAEALQDDHLVAAAFTGNALRFYQPSDRSL